MFCCFYFFCQTLSKISFFLISGTAVSFNPDIFSKLSVLLFGVFACFFASYRWCFLCAFLSFLCRSSFRSLSVFIRLYDLDSALGILFFPLKWWFCIWILEWKFYSDRCIAGTRNSVVTFKFLCGFNIVLSSSFISNFELVFFVLQSSFILTVCIQFWSGNIAPLDSFCICFFNHSWPSFAFFLSLYSRMRWALDFAILKNNNYRFNKTENKQMEYELITGHTCNLRDNTFIVSISLYFINLCSKWGLFVN